jgi:hypothetical protein
MLAAPFKVVLDACVLYPFTIRDVLLQTAAHGFYQVPTMRPPLRRTRSRRRLRALQRAIRASTRCVARLLDELFADPALAAEQQASAAALDAAGSSWNDERW